MKYENILKNFKLESAPVSVELHGHGHINDTYLVCTESGAKYILQRINDKIFSDVEKLMRNIELVAEHLSKKVRAKGLNPKRDTLSLVKTLNNNAYLKTDEGSFRVYDFIDNATSYQSVEKREHFYESAAAFGKFQNDLADFDASLLTNTIADFHNTVKRLSDFKASVKADKMLRAKTSMREIDFILSRADYSNKIVDLLNSGEMPLKVTHNDTKLNNVMIDNATGKGLAVIDLDTVMPGSCCYDFGDSIRFGCNSADEDERDLNKVTFRCDYFDAYVSGYLGALKNITAIEKEYLAFSSILLTYECGMRFLADHLNGDVYFKIKRENHNLDRARTQIKLIEEMEKALPKMEGIVKNYR